MTGTQLERMATAAGVIKRVIGQDFEWQPAGSMHYGKGALMLLIHEAGDALRPYCNYDCQQYQRIEELNDALTAVGLFTEDCDGNYSGVYETRHNEMTSGRD